MEVIPKQVKLDELRYYFDCEAKNSLDKGGHERRNSQVMMLRERLLALPEADFDAAIKTMEKIVAHEPKAPEPDERKVHDDAGYRVRDVIASDGATGCGGHGF